MELRIVRTEKTDTYTIGDFLIDGVWKMYTLEDCDRGLKSNMDLGTIKAIKKHGVTAIPTGEYDVILSKSKRFGIVTPEVLNVPGYLGVRIHSGNSSKDTEGCPLVGNKHPLKKDWIGESRIAFKLLMATLEGKEEITIKIE